MLRIRNGLGKFFVDPTPVWQCTELCLVPKRWSWSGSLPTQPLQTVHWARVAGAASLVSTPTLFTTCFTELSVLLVIAHSDFSFGFGLSDTHFKTALVWDSKIVRGYEDDIEFKGLGKRRDSVAYDVSWARKRAGRKMNIVFPCCANWETFVADTKCFWTKSETVFVSRTQNLCPQQMLRAQANGETFVSATMYH